MENKTKAPKHQKIKFLAEELEKAYNRLPNDEKGLIATVVRIYMEGLIKEIKQLYTHNKKSKT